MKPEIIRRIFSQARDHYLETQKPSQSRNLALDSVQDALKVNEIDKETAKKISTGLWRLSYLWFFGKKP